MRITLFLLILSVAFSGFAQSLHLRKRKAGARSGSAFVASISDSSIKMIDRERLILGEIKSGNIPSFYINLCEIKDTATIEGKVFTVRYFVLPDYLAIGSDSDYFYCPMTPALAQTIAGYLKCSLPTRKISDVIYRNAVVKMTPEPIPPSSEMITVPVFLKHSELVRKQRGFSFYTLPLGNLVAGNKKDIVISNKINDAQGQPRVVIYGWHLSGGKAIQPLYNGHKPDWVDYSHGLRLIQNKVWINGKKTSIKKVLQSEKWNILLSDEGKIEKPWY